MTHIITELLLLLVKLVNKMMARAVCQVAITYRPLAAPVKPSGSEVRGL